MTRAGFVGVPVLFLIAACQPQPGPLAPLRQGPPPPLFLPPAQVVGDVELGDRLLLAGETEAALKAYARAVLAKDKGADALAGLGAANFRLGRLNQAAQVLVAAVERDPTHVGAWNTLGLVRYRQGEIATAREAFRTAFALSGGQSDTVRRNLALAEDQAGQPVYNTDAVQPEFQVVREGQGKYLLLDRAQPAGGAKP